MGFANIPEEIMNMISKVSASHVVVLMAVASYMDEDGLCWPSVETLAEKAGCGQRTVKDALRELVSKNMLKRSKDPSKTRGTVFSWGEIVRESYQSQVRKSCTPENEVGSIYVLPDENVQDLRTKTEKSTQILPEEERSMKKEEELLPSSGTDSNNVRESYQNRFDERFREAIEMTVNAFSHISVQDVQGFYLSKIKLIKDHEPLQKEFINKTTEEAIATVMEWPYKDDGFRGSANWKFFKEVWSKVYWGENRIKIWGFERTEAESYWNRKNNTQATEEEKQAIAKKYIERSKRREKEVLFIKIEKLMQIDIQIKEGEKRVKDLAADFKKLQKLTNADTAIPVNPAFIDAVERLKGQYNEFQQNIFDSENISLDQLNELVVECQVWREKKDADIKAARKKMESFKK